MSNSPCEVEFLAETENIRIVPNFNLSKLFLIGGEVGPFKAGLPLQVPIWLAVNLRQRSKCRILIPDWMDVNTLEKIKEDELNADTFTQMPSEHYMVIGKVLFETCSGEIPNADNTRTLLKDIWDIRTSKFKRSIATFLEAGSNFATVNNLTQMEISSVRPFFPHVLEQLFRLTEDLNGAVNAGRGGDGRRASARFHDSQDDSQDTPNTSSMELDSQSQSQSQNSEDP